VSIADDIRRKRLLFRSWHRGTREADLILGSFADAHLGGFDTAQLDRYEALLGCPDAELYDWIAGRTAPPAAHDHDVTRLLLAFRYMPRGSTAPRPGPRPACAQREGPAQREGEGRQR
jgi:antitoxin CptB